MTTWNGANVYVEIAFDNSPLTAIASCTWVDVTAYARRISTNRGRNTELATYAPGTTTIDLDNRARLFDPTNTAGTYYGKLAPMKRIRVRASYGATSAVLFSGFVLGWPITYPGMVDSVVSVSCVDAFHLLEQSSLPGSAYGASVLADSPSYYWPMQELTDGGSPAAVGNIDLVPAISSNVDLGVGYELGTVGQPYGESAGMVTGRGVAYTPAMTTVPQTIEGWFGPHDLNAGPGITAYVNTTNVFGASLRQNGTQASIYYTNSVANKRAVATSGTASHVDIAYDPTVSPTHYMATVTASTVDLYMNGNLVASVALEAGTHTIGSSSTSQVLVDTQQITATPSTTAMAHVAVYASALTATDAMEHYLAGINAHGHPFGERAGTRIGRILDAIGWPSADRTIGTGETVLGNWAPASATAMSEMRACEEVEQGLLFVAGDGTITFRDRQWQMTATAAVTSQATFGDSGAETMYNDITIDGNRIDFVRNAITVSYSGANVTVKDSTSVGAYGIQADSVTATMLPTWAGYLARQLAAFRLRLRKSPATRIPSLTHDVRAGAGVATNLPVILPLELGYRVTVKRRPTGGTGSLSVACAVQGISHEITPATWEATYYLAPCPPSYTEAPYLVLGDATYGKIGTVAGNTIPY